MARFSTPRKIVIDNAKGFKANQLVKFCQENVIVLIHSTTYYPQGNSLVESSNKILVRIIKKLLQENKKACDSKLKFSLWVDKISTKRSIGTSPYQLVYGTNVVFPISLGSPFMKLLQEKESETNDIQRIINNLIEVHELRGNIFRIAEDYKGNIKSRFDQKAKPNDFYVGDLFLRWDARREKKGLHNKFDHLWMGPFKVTTYRGHNVFILDNVDGSNYQGGPVNGRFLEHYLT